MRRLLLLICSAGLVVPAGGQQVPAISLAAADAVHPHEFTFITSVRELSDGRVIVTDGREQQLLVLDFATGTSREIGRKGRGPGEYAMVAMVRPLAGDSSMMVDLGTRRWVMFLGDRIVDVVPPDHPAILATQGFFLYADAAGRVVRRFDPPTRDGTTYRTDRDSGAVVFVSRRTGRADTVASVRLAPRRLTQQTNAEGRVIASSTFPTQLLPAEEDFVLFPDGALAVARLDPFRVDWLLPDGRRVRGDSLPVPKLAVTARERRAYEARNAGAQSQPTPAGVPAPPAADFPQFIPPFPLGQGVFAGPRGLLLVRRTKSADYPAMSYLVIDRRARLVGTFTLSNRERVEGASDRYLYVSARDEDDVVRLRRHAWR